MHAALPARRDNHSTIATILSRLNRFLPAPIAINGFERVRACSGALIGIVITALVSRYALGNSNTLPFLIAPMGASAVLLFALPSSPLAQPWSILGGNVVSALVGILCARWIGDPMIAASAAVALAIAAMILLRCLHPPGGAIALSAVLGGPAVASAGFGFALVPVGLNSLLLLMAALVFNNATRRPYPHLPAKDHDNKHGTQDALPTDRLGFTPEDLDDVLKQYNQVLDVSRDDLETLFLQTEMHAYRRRFGEITCADIMSHDVVTVEYGTELQEAWTLLRKHNIKALPVLDRARRVIGIITVYDFMKHADLDLHESFDKKLKRFIRRTPGLYSEKPEAVGQIMTRTVRTIRDTSHVVELVPLLSGTGLHHVPVVDHERRLVGIVTQSDLVAALYRGRLNDQRAAA
jgi:CBS domain-containing membrane protein